MASAKDRNQIYEQIAALREQLADLIPKVDAIPEVKRMKGLQAAIAGLEMVAEATRQPTGSRIVTAPQDSEFARLSLPRAGVKFLERTGLPQTDEEIWDALSAGGVTIRAKRPVHAVHKALEHHQTRNRWLQYIDGKWSLRQPDPAKGGIAGGDLKKHSRVTSDGIAHFKARTGGTWGRKPVITAEQIGKFRELYDTGKYSVAAASREAGMSNSYFYMHRESILAWTKDDPWPPRGGVVNEYRTPSVPTQPRLKLVGEDE